MKVPSSGHYFPTAVQVFNCGVHSATHLRSGDAGRMVILDELVETVELDDPEEKLALGVPQHLEVLHTVPALKAQSPKGFRCCQSYPKVF